MPVKKATEKLFIQLLFLLLFACSFFQQGNMTGGQHDMTHPLCCPSLRLPAGTVSMVAGASETKAEETDGTQIQSPGGSHTRTLLKLSSWTRCWRSFLFTNLPQLHHRMPTCFHLSPLGACEDFIRKGHVFLAYLEGQVSLKLNLFHFQVLGSCHFLCEPSLESPTEVSNMTFAQPLLLSPGRLLRV